MWHFESLHRTPRGARTTMHTVLRKKCIQFYSIRCDRRWGANETRDSQSGCALIHLLTLLFNTCGERWEKYSRIQTKPLFKTASISWHEPSHERGSALSSSSSSFSSISLVRQAHTYFATQPPTRVHRLAVCIAAYNSLSVERYCEMWNVVQYLMAFDFVLRQIFTCTVPFPRRATNKNEKILSV